MGRHSAPRRRAPLVVATGLLLLGPAAVAWGLAGPPSRTDPPAPTEQRTVELVEQTPAPTPQTSAPTLVPTPVPSVTPTAPAATAPAPVPAPCGDRDPGDGTVEHADPDAHAVPQGQGAAHPTTHPQAHEDQVSTDPRTFPDRLRGHFGHRDHLYGVLLDEMAADWERGGITRVLLDGWAEADARQVPQLRLLAGLFRIVLRGEAPQLEPYYPVLGGDAAPDDAWAVAEPVLAAHVDELRESLTEAPQTNEPGRAVALLVGLTEAVRRTGIRRVRLLEPGASGGLGLLVDRYRFEGDGWTAGPEGALLVVEGCGARGLVPEPFEVVSRRGCDVAPVDTATEEGATHLTSFVWPWMLERHRRLGAALTEARRHPVTVDRARAAVWVREQLAGPAPDGVLTVVWHSVTRMYWPVEETRAVEQAVVEARTRMPVAHVALEHPWPEGGVVTALDDDLLPRIELDGDVLGTAGHHGPPVELLP